MFNFNFDQFLNLISHLDKFDQLILVVLIIFASIVVICAYKTRVNTRVVISGIISLFFLCLLVISLPCFKTQRNVEIDGEYYYRSTPLNYNQELLKDECDQPFYMLIGTLLIIKDNDGDFSVRAHRKYAVSLNESKEIAIIESFKKKWDAASNRVFKSQKDHDQVIFSLQTMDNPPNEGVYIGETINKNDIVDKKAKLIQGNMFYLNRSNGKWADAEMIMERIENDKLKNIYINPLSIQKWFDENSDHKIKEVIDQSDLKIHKECKKPHSS